MSSAGFVYNREYFLNDCDGHVQFKNSRGKVLGKRLSKMLELTGAEPGMRILDAGCGRGELVLHLGRAKSRACGIDNSAQAIDICRQTLKFWKRDFQDIDRYAGFIGADILHIPFSDGFFDVIVMADVVEHLAAPLLIPALREMRRVLNKGGKLVIHTAPNRYYLPLGGLLFALLSRLLYARPFRRGGSSHLLPWNIRSLMPRGLQPDVHVNEQSSWSLKRALRRSGFRVEKIWFELNPHYIDALFADRRGFLLINALKKMIPVKHLFFAELYCLAGI